MIDRRSQLHADRIAQGLCPRCGEIPDRIGRVCTRCNALMQSVSRQRYRPGQPAAQWTSQWLQHQAALRRRGWV